MTNREKEIFNAVKGIGTAHPRKIGARMGISADYAEQLCRDMVWLRHFVKKGLSYSLVPADENMKSSGIE